ncbi:FliM/FliN family flagellar motor switch protein [Pseudomonas aeruginosa]
MSKENDMADEWAAALSEQGDTPAAAEAPAAVVAEPQQFKELKQESLGAALAGDLNRIRDLPVVISVELSRAERQIKDILEYSPGTVIELDSNVGDPMDMYINDKLVAKGTAVSLDGKFGIRIEEIIPEHERILRRRR